MAASLTELKLSDEEKRLYEFLSSPLTINRRINPLNPYIRLSLGEGADRVSVHYSGHFPVPRMPLFHPYNPNQTREGADANPGIPRTVLTLKCPPETFAYFPEAIKTLLQGVTPTDIYVNTQSMPWSGAEPLLMRAHYWVHGAPSLDSEILSPKCMLNTNCSVAVISSDPNSPITCDGLKNTFTPPLVMSSHTQDNPPITVCSPAGNGALGGINIHRTTSFFSIVKADDGRIALTLHWLLNASDQLALEEGSQQIANESMPTLQKLILGIHKNIPSLGGPLTDLAKIFNTDVQKLQFRRVPPSPPSPPQSPLPIHMPRYISIKKAEDAVIQAAEELSRIQHEREELERLIAEDARMAAALLLADEKANQEADNISRTLAESLEAEDKQAREEATTRDAELATRLQAELQAEQLPLVTAPQTPAQEEYDLKLALEKSEATQVQQPDDDDLMLIQGLEASEAALAKEDAELAAALKASLTPSPTSKKLGR